MFFKKLPIIRVFPLFYFLVFLFSCFLVFLFSFVYAAPNPKTGQVLDLRFGNNNGSSSAVRVYDVSSKRLIASSSVAANTPACNNKFCNFDGSNDYLTAGSGVAGGIFNSSNLGIVIKFSPDFAADDGSRHTFFDTTTANRYTVLKQGTADSNTLDIQLNGTTIGIATATYSPYWQVGKENILIYSGTSGNNNVWLNGTKIVSANTTAWTSANPPDLWIGMLNSLVSEFDGKLYYLKVYNRLLTDAEVAAFSRDRTSFSKAPNKRGIVGYWTMDVNDINPTGVTLYDRSGGNNHGAITGTTTSTGRIKQARNFNGSTDFIATSETAVLRPTSITGMAWVKTTASAWGGIITNGRECSPDLNGYNLELTNTGAFRVVIYTGTDTETILTGSAINNNQWHNVGFSYDGSNLRLYKDGVQDNSTVLTGAIDYTGESGSQQVRLGRSRCSSWTNYFTGNIDDARVYNYALSAQEITNLYNAAKTKYIASAPKTGLIGYWTMDVNDISGTTVYDKSGNNNRGVRTGALGGNNTPQITGGRIKQALDFDGTDDYVNAGTGASLNLTTQVTLSAWVFTDSVADGQSRIERGNSNQYLMQIQSNKLETIIWDGGVAQLANRNAAGGTTLAAGRWYHFAATYDGSNLITYVNGALDRSGAYTGDIDSQAGAQFSIGSNNGVGSYHDGKIDDARLYNYALSAQEVANLYKSSRRNYIK